MSKQLKQTFWIHFSQMSKEEKEANPKAETCEGYLKVITLKEAWANMWGNLTEANKKEFTTLPNFDKNKFEVITGIKI